MSRFDKDERFDELFDNWFDYQFRPYLAANATNYTMWDSYSRGRADAYAEIDEWIDQEIESIRHQVAREFEDWKKEQEEA